MLTKNELKYYGSLLKNKKRLEERKFLVEGKNLVSEGLNSLFYCEIICVTQQFHQANPHLISQIQSKQIRLEIIKSGEFLKLSDTKSPQEICAVFNMPESDGSTKFNDKVVVAFDDINDPGNLGTMIRTCDWFGIKELLFSKSSADLFSPKVVRSTMGSIFHIESFTKNELPIQALLYKQAGYKIMTADLTGENVFDLKPTGKNLIIFSNEAHGPSKEILEITDTRITIPKIGNAESLNVASAAAIILARLTL